MQNPQRYLITSALPYASGITHFGNVVGSTLPADLYARYCRLRGRDTLYVCGSDEHGVAITIAAEKEGITPREIIDRYHGLNKQALANAGIAFDVYDRTSNPVHYDTAQEFFRYWLGKGLLVEREEDQFFDADANMFLPDRYVEGICPNCGYDKARGDQCDNCGAYYNQLDLKHPRSLVSGKAPIVRKTKHWYFKLDEFQKWTEQYVESHATDWKSNVLQQSRSWLKQGLAQRAATRDMKWGIPVPAPDADGKVIYVWFEAVLGYISATKQWAKDNGIDAAWQRWWCDAGTEYIAFLGKDNIVFHTIIFPILLHTREDEGYILPKQVPANEFMNLEGQKFSKSRNWAIDLVQYQQDFPEPQHSDVLRYVLTVNMPESKDSDFTWKDFQARTNNELAAILGNYINRVMQFVQKNYDLCVPTIPAEAIRTEHETALASAIESGIAIIADNYDAFRFRDAATETMNVARAANKYFNDKAPWKTLKADPADCALTLNTCLQTARTLSVLIAPILPNAAETIQRMLNVSVHTGAPFKPQTADESGTTDKPDAASQNVWFAAAEAVLKASAPLNEPHILFTKIEDDVVERQVAKLGPSEKGNASASGAATIAGAAGAGGAATVTVDGGRISIDQFKNVQLRTARVLEAERVSKSEKLLKLKVDIGTEHRQILAGIAKHYTPEELIGRLVVVVSNLQPAKLMGMESQGMVLAASNADGTLTLVTPMNDVVGAGAEVR